MGKNGRNKKRLKHLRFLMESIHANKYNHAHIITHKLSCHFESI